MKLTHLFTRKGRMALAAALGLFIVAPTVSDAAVVALKVNTDLDYLA